jgi:acetaldehyde dehydrogenase (acetylating)
MAGKIKAAIVGPGNIGMDLMFKLMKSDCIELDSVIGIIPNSEGLQLAAKYGFKTSDQGVEAILDNKEIKIVFDATSAKGHLHNAPLLKAAGMIAIDLTPAALGPYAVPAVNRDLNLDLMNVNMVTCGGQATIPIVAAIARTGAVQQAEIVATIASKSAGPGTRANIDEFTETTAHGLEKVGGAARGKAIIILNPANPPIMMRDTIYTLVDSPDLKQITDSVNEMVNTVRKYVPGYRLKLPPTLDGNRVTVMIEVEGEGAYLPKYSGNLDIMTAAAKATGEQFARKLLVN